MHLQCDQLFTLRDENALLHNMGLTTAADADLRRIFGVEIEEYLKTQQLISTSSNNDSKVKKIERPEQLLQFQVNDENRQDYFEYQQKMITPNFTEQNSFAKHTPLTKLLPNS